MPTANEEVLAFLADNGLTDPRQLDVAIVYAESMVRELRAAVGQWEEATVTLHEMQDRQAASSPADVN